MKGGVNYGKETKTKTGSWRPREVTIFFQVRWVILIINFAHRTTL